MRWFSLCLAAGVWIALGLILAATVTGPVALGAVPMVSVGVYLGWRAYREDIS